MSDSPLGMSDSSLVSSSVQSQLERIGASRTFSGSERPRKLLTFLVERVLAGEAGTLSEHLLATEVFNRGPAFRADLDPIVRVEMNRLRKKLAAYHEGEGAQDSVIIELPSRTYVPIIRTRIAEPATPVAVSEQTATPPLRRLLPFLLFAGALLMLAVIAASGIIWKSGQGSVGKVSAKTVSLLVLPFEDFTSGPSESQFAEGLTHQLIKELAQHGHGLVVAAHTSSRALLGKPTDVRQTGARFKVSLILEGSVRRSGSHLKVTVGQVDTTSGFHLWARSYEREVSDELMSQKDLAHAIASDVVAQLGISPQDQERR